LPDSNATDYSRLNSSHDTHDEVPGDGLGWGSEIENLRGVGSPENGFGQGSEIGDFRGFGVPGDGFAEGFEIEDLRRLGQGLEILEGLRGR